MIVALVAVLYLIGSCVSLVYAVRYTDMSSRYADVDGLMIMMWLGLWPLMWIMSAVLEFLFWLITIGERGRH